jgi:hypothetical protein
MSIPCYSIHPTDDTNPQKCIHMFTKEDKQEPQTGKKSSSQQNGCRNCITFIQKETTATILVDAVPKDTRIALYVQVCLGGCFWVRLNMWMGGLGKEDYPPLCGDVSGHPAMHGLNKTKLRNRRSCPFVFLSVCLIGILVFYPWASIIALVFLSFQLADIQWIMGLVNLHNHIRQFLRTSLFILCTCVLSVCVYVYMYMCIKSCFSGEHWRIQPHMPWWNSQF